MYPGLVTKSDERADLEDRHQYAAVENEEKESTNQPCRSEAELA